MKRLLLVGSMVLGTAFGAAVSAQATPASTALGGIGNGHSGIELAAYKRNRHFKRHGNYGRNHWRHNRGYGHDRYRGWHRYHARPWNWRTRGCVVVGPLWVCP